MYPRSYALVIGMDGYAAWPKLGKAVSDSAAVRDALQAHGYVVTHKTNLSARELRDTLEEFFIERGADKEAGLFLWYAGHGHTINGEGYLVPIDAPVPTGSDTEFRRRAFSMRDFGRLMREARSKHVLAVFDSCFAGTVFKTARAGVPPAINNALTYPVRQFISAGDHTQTVADDGAFQRTFVDAIMGREANVDHDKDGFVTGQEIGIFMHNKLLNLSGGRQTPRFGQLAEGDFDRGDFVFRVGAPGAGAQLVPPAPSAPLALVPSAFAARDPMAHLRSNKVFVATVVGAPGDGAGRLREALSKRLMNQGFEVIDFPLETAFRVHGTVLNRSMGALADEVLIRWQVFGPSGASLGAVEDRIETLPGAYNVTWGSDADRAAAFASDRLVRFLARPG